VLADYSVIGGNFALIARDHLSKGPAPGRSSCSVDSHLFSFLSDGDLSEWLDSVVDGGLERSMLTAGWLGGWVGLAGGFFPVPGPSSILIRNDPPPNHPPPQRNDDDDDDNRLCGGHR